MILGIIVLFLLILIPGWRTVFAQKTFSEGWQMLTSDFFGTFGKVISTAFSYYSSWFQSEETQAKIQNTKDKIIETLEKRIRGEKPTGETK